MLRTAYQLWLIDNPRERSGAGWISFQAEICDDFRWANAHDG